MEISSQILSDMIVYMKYARYLPEKNRREIWAEIISRNKDMHLKKFPFLKDEIEEAYTFVYNKEVLPSMRSLQFGGKPIILNPARINNCSYLPIDSWEAFHETIFLLLGGSGVGYSVQPHHVAQLPSIKQETKKRSRRYLVGDSICGWSDAIKVLMKSYFFGGAQINFDFSDIRNKGDHLITSGGKAPGPQPLKECIVKVTGILEEAKVTTGRLSPIQCHDILCHLADAVLSGGIRRAALISFFSINDEEMLSAKTGNWWELNPQRGRANNSVVLVRSRIKKEDFVKVFTYAQNAGSGEPGIYFTNDKDVLSNPCGEISLKPYSFCNLTEINASTIRSQEDLNKRAKAASFIGTLQASYTDFHYLRSIWKERTEKDALIGVSFTGIASNKLEKLDLKEAAKVVLDENARVADLIGINHAKRTTTVKPAGTSSIVLGSSSGIHDWFAKYYIRRIRLNKEEAVYRYLLKNNPELIEDDYFSPHTTAILSVPQKAPTGAIIRQDENAQNISGLISLLERISKYYNEWVTPGHRSGPNINNVSATVTIRDPFLCDETSEVIDEWEIVREWMWKNRKNFNGISVLPYNGGTYRQQPFEACSEYMYNKLMKSLTEVDFKKIKESEDNTVRQGEIACSGGQCEII